MSFDCRIEATASSGFARDDQAALFRTALPAPQGDGSGKGDPNIACLTLPGWLTAANGSSPYAVLNKGKSL